MKIYTVKPKIMFLLQGKEAVSSKICSLNEVIQQVNCFKYVGYVTYENKGIICEKTWITAD